MRSHKRKKGNILFRKIMWSLSLIILINCISGSRKPAAFPLSLYLQLESTEAIGTYSLSCDIT